MSRASHGRQAARSAAVGLLAGGGQRTAATMRTSGSADPAAAHPVRRRWPGRSGADSRRGCPPDRSPVKFTPVRLAPCGEGARPTISTRGWIAPLAGTGRPQYVLSRWAGRRVRATSSRQPTKRGQARPTDTLAESWGDDAPVASRWTSLAVRDRCVRRRRITSLVLPHRAVSPCSRNGVRTADSEFGTSVNLPIRRAGSGPLRTAVPNG